MFLEGSGSEMDEREGANIVESESEEVIEWGGDETTERWALCSSLFSVDLAR